MINLSLDMIGRVRKCEPAKDKDDVYLTLADEQSEWHNAVSITLPNMPNVKKGDVVHFVGTGEYTSGKRKDGTYFQGLVMHDYKFTRVNVSFDEVKASK